MEKVNQRKMDWHLVIAVASIVISLSGVIIGCYVSTNTRLTRIETVLIMQKIMPMEMAAKVENKNGT